MDFDDVKKEIEEEREKAERAYIQVRAAYRPWWLYVLLALIMIGIFFWMKWAVEGWAEQKADQKYAQNRVQDAAEDVARQAKIDSQQQIIDQLKDNIKDLRNTALQQDAAINDTRRLVDQQILRTRASGAAVAAVRTGTYKRLGSDAERQRELQQLYQK